MSLVLRNVELNGARADVRIEHDRIAAIGANLPRGGEEIDARGGALIPGLIDHHIHLFATAARMDSVDLSAADSKDALIAALRAASASCPRGAWIRGVAYDDTRVGLISRDDLDISGLDNPIRVQDRTGALWILNSRAFEGVTDLTPSSVERDAAGRLTGRIWRGDDWLRQHTRSSPPSLASLSAQLASCGVIGVTDTGAVNGEAEARLLAAARGRGELSQSLNLMSADAIPTSPFYTIGPIKILPDERDLPDIETIIAHMRRARALGRRIAVHCVTAAELVLALAAFEAVGAQRGDRLEHGGVIPEALLENIRALDLTIVTQPNFIHDRGDRYARDIGADELPDLYRLASLRAAGIAVAAGSDAPYGGLDPWRAIQAATDRTSAGGVVIGANERISAREALSLYLGPFDDPGGAARQISVGAPADLCLLHTPLDAALAAPSAANVAATIARGEIIYRA